MRSDIVHFVRCVSFRDMLLTWKLTNVLWYLDNGRHAVKCTRSVVEVPLGLGLLGRVVDALSNTDTEVRK